MRELGLVLGVCLSSVVWAAPDGAFGLGTGKDGTLTVSMSTTIAINDYTRLSASAAVGATVIDIPDDATAPSFRGPFSPGGGTGDLIMLWQPAGLSPVPQTNNGISPVDVASSGAGKRELARIIARTAAAGVVSLTLTTAECVASPCSTGSQGLKNAFDLAKTQVVRVPEYATVTVNAGASVVPRQAWSRATLKGGIVALLSRGAVTLASGASISAVGFGFAPGGPPRPDSSGNVACSTRDCDPSGTNPPGQFKGEGLAGDTTGASLNGCFGALANGGGGGDCIRTGGGGGANAGAGGRGGFGFDPVGMMFSTNTGSGGSSVPYGDPVSPISLTRSLVMGGGGGSGHNSGSGAIGGQRGGGVIFIRAASVDGAATSLITAGGGPVSGSGGVDGQGGGGAGGSIYIRTTAAASSMCSFGQIAARGSNGVSSPLGANGGPGGGGGGGRIFIQSPQASCQTNPGVTGGIVGGGSQPGGTNGADGSHEGASPADVLSTAKLTSAYCSDDPGAAATAPCPPGLNCDSTQNRCVLCRTLQNDSDCPATDPECTVSTNTCGNCLADTGANPSASPSCTRFAPGAPPLTHCETDNNQGSKLGDCVECTLSRHCPNSKPVCDLTNTATGDSCAACTLPAHCAGQTAPDGTARPPVCLVATGACVQCASNADCAGTPATPSCDPTTFTCVACDGLSGDLGCSTGHCHRSGEVGSAPVGRCVECTGSTTNDANAQCIGAAGAPACTATNSCAACTAVAGDLGCGGHVGTPWCEADDNEGKLGQCVQCLDSSACAASAPICAADVCRSCAVAGGNAACEARLGSAPSCNSSSGACGPCVTDADCTVSASRPACQGDGSCRQCSASNVSQCDLTRPACASGACGDCSQESHCTRFPSAAHCETNPLDPTGKKGECVACRSDTLHVDCTTNDRARCGVTNTCVDCAADGECANGVHGVALHCETATRTGDCVECRSTNASADCATSRPVCSSLACSACTADPQCTRFGSAFACDQTSGACGECLTDADCVSPMAPRCAGGVCSGCLTAGDCAAQLDAGSNRPACEAPLGFCQLCTVGDGGTGDSRACASAPEGHACQGTGAAVFCGCSLDGDCGAATSGRVCNDSTRTCIDGCSREVGRNGCPAGQFCTVGDAGMCTASCALDVDCPLSMSHCVVDGGSATCLACRDDVDCAAPRAVCANAACVECGPGKAQACSASGAGAACRSDFTCGCASAADCAAPNPACDGITLRCVADPAVDGGQIDGGADAGEGGQTPRGCGCGAAGSAPLLLALAAMLRRRRQ